MTEAKYKEYVMNNTHIGMKFIVRKEMKGTIIRYDGDSRRYRIDSYYPHVVLAIDQAGLKESFSYKNMYDIINNNLEGSE